MNSVNLDTTAIYFDIQRFDDTVTPTDGNDIIYNKNGDYTFIDAAGGDDYIYGLDNDYVTIHGNEGSDTIVGSFYHSEIYGDNGDDSISIISSNDSNSIYGGAGNDTIYAISGSIDGGDGDDVIMLIATYANSSTVKGGKGNDTVYGYRGTDESALLYQFSVGDGDDLFYNYQKNDTISVGNSWSTIPVNKDSIIFDGVHTIDSDSEIGDSWYLGTVQLKDKTLVSVAADSVYIEGSNDTSTTVPAVDLSAYKDVFNFTLTAKKVMTDVVVTLDGGATETSKQYVETISAAVDGSHVLVHVTDSYGSTDTGNILLWNAGGKKINMAQSGKFIYNTTPNAVISVPSSDQNVDSDITYAVTALNDIVDNLGNNSTISTGAGDDSIVSNNATVTVNGGAGNDTISGTFLSSSVLGGTGNDYIIISGDSNIIDGGAGNDTIIGGVGSINAGDGNDVISLNGGTANTVVGGKGNDTIYGDSNTTAGVLYQYFYGDGTDIIYNYHSNDTLAIADANNSDAKIVWATVVSGNNVIVNVSGSGTITLYNASDTTLNITGEGSNYITNVDNNATIGGNSSNSDIIGKNTNSSSNTTVSSNSDSVSSSSGNRSRTRQQILPTTPADTTPAATLPAVTTPAETVAPVTVPASTTNSTSTTTRTTTTTTPVTVQTATSAATAEFNSSKSLLSIKGNFGSNVWLGGNPFTGQRDSYANDNTVTIDASQQTGNSLILAGNNKNNVIRAGGGNSSLWGGISGNDTLYGGSGRDMFWFTAGGGNDVVRNFNAGTDTDSDVLNLVGNLTELSRTNGSLFLKMDDGSSLDINFKDSGVDKAVQYSTNAANIIRAKIGNTNKSDTLTYETGVDYYIAGGGENTLSVGGGNNVEVWLDSDKFYDIKDINARDSSGNVLLAGDGADNKIASGSGNSSLWGGVGGNDTLIGGDGFDMFWYGRHNGNDIIQNAGDGDIINLFDINLADLAGAVKSGGNLVITTTDGDNLTVTGNSAATFRLADGSSWKYNHSDNSWNQA